MLWRHRPQDGPREGLCPAPQRLHGVCVCVCACVCVYARACALYAWCGPWPEIACSRLGGLVAAAAHLSGFPSYHRTIKWMSHYLSCVQDVWMLYDHTQTWPHKRGAAEAALRRFQVSPPGPSNIDNRTSAQDTCGKGIITALLRTRTRLMNARALPPPPSQESSPTPVNIMVYDVGVLRRVFPGLR
jgi:hypothetical protein